MKIFKKKKNRFLEKIGDSINRVQTAVTYAEADSHDEAMEVLSAPRPKASIVVLGKGWDFSPALREYAIGLAQRLDYNILAVSSRHVAMDIGRFADQVKKEFSEKAAVSADSFQSEAQKAGISFSHQVKFGEGTDVLRALQKEVVHLEYVVCEPDECENKNEKPAIPVFSLAYSG